MTTPGDIPDPPPALSLNLDDLVARARALIVPGQRRILGITGAPAAGKSTVCAALAAALGEDAAVVPMDGFHLANGELVRLGRRDRKGAPDTFDAGGYAALLDRVRQERESTVYAPLFDRSLEESIGSAVPVFAHTPLIITEGNYLLLDGEAWRRARAAIDVVWYLDLPDEVRVARLVRRHESHGRSRDEAVAWAQQVDQRNAELIAGTRNRADLIVQVGS
ncbi:nucleoside/nucleotide kinase family protein [Deinococcus koreensis]|uniref:Nucleoside/nucleotide kinase family protein n=1 Tax=Deinococcus koreensis TaxID=2054903 RepID=A0A2K3UTL5_9DEIO|nr:nucleoside/nucleotide kinase family protein [Deinococcus koreensis]PNY79868.1 nucleoside/nucleotide kinase family protein [Deinococcus koreensis]